VTDLEHVKTARRIQFFAVAFAVISLLLPWWSFILLEEGNLISFFHLFLLGVWKEGFMRADLSFEWWCYPAFILVAMASTLGVICYLSLRKENGKAKILLISQSACMLGSVLLYLSGIVYTIEHTLSGFQSFWMTSPSEGHTPFSVRLFVFNYSIQSGLYEITAFWFLSIGFFIAVLSAVLSSIAVYMIAKPRRIG
jgi:uncharacterized membrane protein